MGSNFLTSIQVGCLAAPEWVLTNNKNILIQKIFWFKTSSYSTTPAMASRIRQNYKEESEALINKQIIMEFYASYVYMSMYTYFDRDDVAYKGLAAFFKKSSDEEREHGEKLIQYQNKREARSSSKILLNPAPWNGDPLSMPLKQLLNWRRPSIKVFLTCTRHLMAMLTFATSLKENSLANKLTRSRRFPYGLPR